MIPRVIFFSEINHEHIYIYIYICIYFPKVNQHGCWVLTSQSFWLIMNIETEKQVLFFYVGKVGDERKLFCGFKHA